MIFNKFGKAADDALDCADITIYAAIKNFLKAHPDITALEMRACCQYLMNTVDSAFTEQILINTTRKEMKRRVNHNAKIHKKCLG